MIAGALLAFAHAPAQGRGSACETAFSRRSAIVSGLMHGHQSTQQRFNLGTYRTLVEDPRFNRFVSGLVPYWDVSPERLDYQPVGRFSESPFRTSDGKIRLFVHHADARMIEELKDTFGEPSGSVPVELQSSGRTVRIASGAHQHGFFKFSGAWFDSDKKLSAEDVRASVARSQELESDGPTNGFMLETSGIVVRLRSGAELNIIYREPHFADRPSLPLADSDRLSILHVVLSRKFIESPEFQAYFGTMDAYTRWLIEDLAPELARILMRSLFKLGTHLELHSQNIDLLTGERAKIKQSFVKDLLDVLDDPMLRIAIGRQPVNRPDLSKTEIAAHAKGDQDSDLELWYYGFLGSVLKEIKARVGNDNFQAFQLRLKAEVSQRYFAYMESRGFSGLENYLEYRALVGQMSASERALHPRGKKYEEHFEALLADMRELVIKADIAKNFTEDDRVQDEVRGSIYEKQFIAPHFKPTYPPSSLVRKYGFYRGRPIEVVYNRDQSAVLHYSMPYVRSF